MESAPNALRFTRSRWYLVACYLFFFALFSYLLHRNRGVLQTFSLSLENTLILGSVLSLVLVNALLRGLLNAVAFNIGGRKIGLRDGYKLAAIHTIGNYLPFSGGLIAKGYLLKSAHNVSYTHFMLLSFFTFTTTLSISGATGLYAAIRMQSAHYLLIAAFSMMVAAGVFAFIPAPRVGWLKRSQYPEAWGEANVYYRTVFHKIGIISLMIIILYAVRLSQCFSIVNHDLSIEGAVLLTSGSILTRVVTVTPGAIGIREAFVAALAHLTGVNYQMAMIAVGIDRLAEMVAMFGSYGIMVLYEKTKRADGVSV